MSDIRPALAPSEWEVVTIPGVPADRALAVRAIGVDGFVEVRTRTNFADLKVDADRIALALNGFEFTREDVQLPIKDISLAIESLNDAYASDPAAIHSLICIRIPCNEALARHPTVQVGESWVTSPAYLNVGVLGLLNGVVEPLTGKTIAAQFTDDKKPKLLGFIEYLPPEEK